MAFTGNFKEGGATGEFNIVRMGSERKGVNRIGMCVHNSYDFLVYSAFTLTN